VVVKVRGPSGEAKVETKQVESNQFEVSYEAPEVGNYLITILLYGRNILGQPLKAVVVPPTNLVATGVISGKGVSGQVTGGAHAGAGGVVTKGQAVSGGAHAGAGGAAGGHVNTGKPLPPDVASTLVFPELCEVSSPDGLGVSPQLDDDSLFLSVSAKDKDGKPIIGAPCQAFATLGNKKIPVPIKDKKDGTFEIDWEPEDEGVHHVDVLVGGKPVKGSPFQIDVKPTASKKHSCLEFKHLIQCSVKVQTFHRNGKPKTTGGENIKINVKGPDGNIDFEVKDNSDGTYTVSWEGHPGEFEVSAKLRGHHIKGSPFIYVASFSVKK